MDNIINNKFIKLYNQKYIINRDKIYSYNNECKFAKLYNTFGDKFKYMPGKLILPIYKINNKYYIDNDFEIMKMDLNYHDIIMELPFINSSNKLNPFLIFKDNYCKYLKKKEVLKEIKNGEIKYYIPISNNYINFHFINKDINKLRKVIGNCYDNYPNTHDEVIKLYHMIIPNIIEKDINYENKIKELEEKIKDLENEITKLKK